MGSWLTSLVFCRFEADEILTVRKIVHPVLQAEWDLRWGGMRGRSRPRLQPKDVQLQDTGVPGGAGTRERGLGLGGIVPRTCELHTARAGRISAEDPAWGGGRCHDAVMRRGHLLQVPGAP